MKITIDIPKKYERHFDNDRFKDSLKRISTDVMDEIESDFAISGKYEIEFCEMLIKAFENAELVEHGRWIYGENESGLDGIFCSECEHFVPWCYDYYDKSDDLINDNLWCPNCGARMDGD